MFYLKRSIIKMYPDCFQLLISQTWMWKSEIYQPGSLMVGKSVPPEEELCVYKWLSSTLIGKAKIHTKVEGEMLIKTVPHIHETN